jgi:predicted Zn-dependent peptidase
MTQPIRNIAPDIQDIKSVEIIKPQQFILDNGVQVYVFNNPQQDLVKINLVFDAGTVKSSKPWVANTVNSMLTEVTKNYSASELAEKIDFYGSYFETNTSRDHASVALYSLNKFLENTIPLLSEIITNASFAKNEFDSYIARKKQELEVNLEKVNYIARQRFTSLLFGKNHPYGRYSELADLLSLQRDDLIDFHKKHYAEGEFKIFIAGNFGDAELELLNNYLGNLPNRKMESGIIDWSKTPSKEKEVLISKDGAVQNALRIGFNAPHRDHEDYFGLKILTTIFGGYFGSRLMNNIREDKGYTYGIGAGISSFKKESVFFISTEVKSDVCDDAINEIFKEMDILNKELVSESELFTVKNYLQGTFQRSFDGSFNLLDRYMEFNLNGLDDNYYNNYIEKIKSIDSQELLLLAQKYYKRDSFYLLNVGQN